MPFSALASMAREAGRSPAAAERYWRESKGKVRPQAGKGRGKHSYRYLMQIVKSRLGLGG